MTKEAPAMKTLKPRRAMDVVVGKRGTIVIPAELRKALGIRQGQRLVVILEDGDVVLHPVPEDPLERLREAAGDLFKGVDGVAYQRSLRDEDEEG